MNLNNQEIYNKLLSTKGMDTIFECSIPSSPVILRKLLAQVNSAVIDHDSVKKLILSDPSMALRSLFVMDSAGLLNDNNDISSAINELPDSLLRVYISSVLIQAISKGQSDEQGINLNGFRYHGKIVAEAAYRLASAVKYKSLEEAYFAGLIHDVGELLSLSSFGAGYGLLLGICGTEEELLKLEPTYTGTDHCSVCAAFLDSLNIPSFLSDAILFHHSPFSFIKGADLLSRILWSAHKVSFWDSADENLTIYHEAADVLALDVSLIRQIYQDSIASASEELISIGIDKKEIFKSIPSLSHLQQDICLPANEQSDSVSVVNEAAVEMALYHLFSMVDIENSNLADMASISSRIIFGLPSIIFFNVSVDSGKISPVFSVSMPKRINELDLTLDQSEFLSAAVERRSIVSTFDSDCGLSASDLQLCRLFSSQGFIAVPAVRRDGTVLLFVIPMSEDSFKRKQKYLSIFSSFASAAASAFDSSESRAFRESRMEQELSSSFKKHAKRIVHEVSNPLGVIDNYLSIVSGKISGDSGISDEIAILKEEIGRVQRIVGQMTSLPSLSEFKDKTDLSSVVDGMLALYADSLFSSRGIGVNKKLSEPQLFVAAERDKLKQIILNIWKNSSEAMTSGGIISVSARKVVNLSGAAFVDLTISDTGPGLPAYVLSNLYSPIESGHKPEHQGVGLSIVASLVDLCGGEILCNSVPASGTSFTILFPAL